MTITDHMRTLCRRSLFGSTWFFLLLSLVFIDSLQAIETDDARTLPKLPKDSILASGSQGDHHVKEIVDLPHGGPRMYWDHGFRIVDDKNRWNLKIAGKFIYDAGNLYTHGDVRRAFPEIAGTEGKFRRLTVGVSGDLGRRSSFNIEVDFSQIQEILDNWIRFKEIPLLGQLTLGHLREPFSLDNLAGIHSRTFVEQSLAGLAMSPGRNIGLLVNRPILNDRMTFALGGYFDTGSFRNPSEAKNWIDNHNGYNITGRITGLPWYEDDGKRLIHMGLSLSHQSRPDGEDDEGVRFRARPESRLTDTRLVDTGQFVARRNELVNAELAVVFQNLSFQGEFFHTFLDASDFNDPRFWGGYLYGSYLITGEHRYYEASRGLFGRVTPRHPFSFKNRWWGAWELALRYSHVDLNYNRVQGGIESNWTLGLNWHINRYTRIMLNAIHGRVRDRKTQPAIESGSIDIMQIRLQIAY